MPVQEATAAVFSTDLGEEKTLKLPLFHGFALKSLPVIDASRTFFLAPSPEIRSIFKKIRIFSSDPSKRVNV
jgi:hypothetical protein